jgi:hypothetical protein
MAVDSLSLVCQTMICRISSISKIQWGIFGLVVDERGRMSVLGKSSWSACCPASASPTRPSSTRYACVYPAAEYKPDLCAYWLLKPPPIFSPKLAISNRESACPSRPVPSIDCPCCLRIHQLMTQIYPDASLRRVPGPCARP